MVIIEVIDCLAVLQTHVIDVADSCRPFEVVVWRPYVLVLKPTLLGECLAQFSVTPFDDEYSLVVAHSIFPFPSLEIHDFCLFLKFFLLNFVFLVIVYFFFILLFVWTVAVIVRNHWTFRLILQTSQLFVCIVVEFYTTFVFTLWILVFYHPLLDFVGL